MKYDFSYFLLISKTYKLGKLPRKGKKKNLSTQDSLTFVNAEEELFFKASYTIWSECERLFWDLILYFRMTRSILHMYV